MDGSSITYRLNQSMVIVRPKRGVDWKAIRTSYQANAFDEAFALCFSGFCFVIQTDGFLIALDP